MLQLSARRCCNTRCAGGGLPTSHASASRKRAPHPGRVRRSRRPVDDCWHPTELHLVKLARSNSIGNRPRRRCPVGVGPAASWDQGPARDQLRGDPRRRFGQSGRSRNVKGRAEGNSRTGPDMGTCVEAVIVRPAGACRGSGARQPTGRAAAGRACPARPARAQPGTGRLRRRPHRRALGRGPARRRRQRPPGPGVETAASPRRGRHPGRRPAHPRAGLRCSPSSRTPSTSTGSSTS